jgi:glycerophosphoryl diester phosphodiesterase
MKRLQHTILLIFLTLIVSLSFTGGPGKGTNHCIDAKSARGLRDLFHYNGKLLPFYSSHRGGPEDNMPENCIATYANTLKYSYSMMEIDPRYTKDSVMVIHHDPTLNRTTTGTGKVIDYTYNELKELRLKDKKGHPTQYQIPTFEEVLEWGRGKTIFVLDKKDVPIEARIRMIEKHKAESYCIVMAYSFEEAKACYRMNKDIMMQVFVPDTKKAAEFDKTGVPWSNVVVFIAHAFPKDKDVIRVIHEKGARCILGTSRNIDLQLTTGKVASIRDLKDEYNALTQAGIDILETDIPVPVSQVLDNLKSVDPSVKKYFKMK